MDTGSSHNLINTKVFQELKIISTPTKMNMKVAGSVLKDNIVGKSIIPITFANQYDEKITIPINFLIANHLNGYQSIIGAEFLLNDQYLTAITLSSLHLCNKYDKFQIQLHNVNKQSHCNMMQPIKPEIIQPNSTRIISLQKTESILQHNIASLHKNINILDV